MTRILPLDQDWSEPPKKVYEPPVLSERDVVAIDKRLSRHILNPDSLSKKQRAIFDTLRAKIDSFDLGDSDAMVRIHTMWFHPEKYKVRLAHYQAAVYGLIWARNNMVAFLERRLSGIDTSRIIVEGPDRKTEGFVYFIEAGGHIKIGFTINVQSRVAQIETSTPFTVTVLRQEPGTMATEAAYHIRFAAQHIKGEWFRFEGGLKEFLEGAQ